MKSVSNLDGVGGSPTASCRIKTTPVSRNDLHSWMSLKPVGEALGGSIREKIDDCMVLQIHQDRAVALTLAPGPVVDADHARIRLRTSSSAHAT